MVRHYEASLSRMDGGIGIVDHLLSLLHPQWSLKPNSMPLRPNIRNLPGRAEVWTIDSVGNNYPKYVRRLIII